MLLLGLFCGAAGTGTSGESNVEFSGCTNTLGLKLSTFAMPFCVLIRCLLLRRYIAPSRVCTENDLASCCWIILAGFHILPN